MAKEAQGQAFAKVCRDCAKTCKQAAWCVLVACPIYEPSQAWLDAHPKAAARLTNAVHNA